VATVKVVTVLPDASLRISGSFVSRPMSITLFIPTSWPQSLAAFPCRRTAGLDGGDISDRRLSPNLLWLHCHLRMKISGIPIVWTA
jgi:hypothetical protein